MQGRSVRVLVGFCSEIWKENSAVCGWFKGKAFTFYINVLVWCGQTISHYHEKVITLIFWFQDVALSLFTRERFAKVKNACIPLLIEVLYSAVWGMHVWDSVCQGRILFFLGVKAWLLQYMCIVWRLGESTPRRARSDPKFTNMCLLVDKESKCVSGVATSCWLENGGGYEHREVARETVYGSHSRRLKAYPHW